MERLLTLQQVSELLGVRPSTIYKWTHRGFIPHTKVGRLLRFRESTINKWLDKRSCRGRTTRTVNVGQFVDDDGATD